MKVARQLLCALPLTGKLPVSAHTPCWMYQLSNAAKLKHLTCLSTQGIPFSSRKVNICESPPLGKECLLVLLFMHWLPWYFHRNVYSVTWLHLQAFSKVFFFFLIFKLFQSILVKSSFSQIVSAPWSSQESILHFWLFPSEGRKADELQIQPPCCCLHCPA